jgi:two-component sensor histidine kinase
LQKEQHHRVHNSLGIISSLLNKYKDTITPEKLADIDNNIIAISTVHRQLYKGDTLETVYFQPIVEKMSSSLLAQYGLNHDIQILIAAKVNVPQKISTILALMINELITNSLKYAFTNIDEKKIFVTVETKKTNIILTYKDSGVGYDAAFLKQKSEGFGRILLEGLANQLRGKISFFNENGACCIIKL